jgi:hypothetical protein
MEQRLILFAHGKRSILLAALFVQESPVEVLLSAGRFGLQPVEHLFVEEGARPLRHRTFVHDVLNFAQDAIGRKLPLGQPVQGFALLRKPFNRSRECRSLLLEVVLLPVQDVAE